MAARLRTALACIIILCSLFLTGLVVLYTFLDDRPHMQLRPGVHYACQTDNGRLGNHIFQYASIYGIARRHNMTFIVGQNDDLVRYFKIPSAERRKNREVCQKFKRRTSPKCCIFDPTLMNLEPGNYMLGEYLQSWRYFKDVVPEVRRELSFNDYIIQDVSYILNNIKATYLLKFSVQPVMVGVHIRRGDIATKRFIYEDGVMVAPDEYIFNAVDFFLEKYGKHIVFVVCSDAMGYAENIMKYRNITTEFFHISPIFDLALISSCDHVLTTIGTFGWWAGFLSNGTVVYYKYPMREGSPIRPSYNYSDFFFPTWIGLDGNTKFRSVPLVPRLNRIHKS